MNGGIGAERLAVKWRARKSAVAGPQRRTTAMAEVPGAVRSKAALSRDTVIGWCGVWECPALPTHA